MKHFFFLLVLLTLSTTLMAQVPIAPGALGKTPDSNLLGFNGGFMFAPGNIYLRPEAEKLVTELGSKTIRFPGGTVGNCYHLYKKGTLTEESGYGIRISEGSCGLPSLRGLYKPQTLLPVSSRPANHIHNFIAHAKRVGAKVVYMPNIVWGDKRIENNETIFVETEEVLRRFQASGVEVVGIEMGNELFFGQYQRTGECKDVNDYLNRLARPLAQRIRKLYPKMKISLITPGFFDDPSLGTVSIQWQNNWNLGIKAEMDKYPELYQAYSIHVYPNSKLSGTHEELAVSAYPSVSDSDPNGSLVKRMRDYFEPRFPGKEAWITEWNMNTNGTSGTLSVLLNTMFQGCMVSELLGSIIKNNDWIKLSHFHAYVSQGISNGALFSPPAGFPNLNGSPRITASVNYYAHLFYSRALADNAALISLSNASIKNKAGSVPNGTSLVVLQSKITNRTHAVYVNCSGEQTTLSVGPMKLKSNDSLAADAPHFSAGGAGWSRTNPSLEVGQLIKRLTGTASGSTLALAPYTFGVVEISP
jgi:hypothetical protein